MKSFKKKKGKMHNRAKVQAFTSRSSLSVFRKGQRIVNMERELDLAPASIICWLCNS